MHIRIYAVNQCPKHGKNCPEAASLKQIVVGPSEEELESYERFLKEVVNFYKQLNVSMHQPNVRIGGKDIRLIPSPMQDPCVICKDAEYNRSCQRTKECAPLIYHNLNRLNALLPRSEKCSATPASEPGPTPIRKPASSADKAATSTLRTSSDQRPRRSSAKPGHHNSALRKLLKKR